MGYQVDATDRRIIAALQANGRTSNLELARQIGVVEGTIRKRLERLLAEGIIKVSVATHYEALGYGTHVLFLIQADLGRVQAIAENLACRPEAVAIWQTTGGCDLVVEAVFPSDRDLVAFLQEDLANISGLGRVETVHLLGGLKRFSQWALPEVIPVREKTAQAATILIVDDDPTFLEATQAVLESRGYRVQTARNGDEALASMREAKPDLAILDIMMTYLLEGIHISQVMGEEEALRSIPILMVSALPRTEHVGMFPTDESLRAADFLTKPVAPSTLLSRVEKVLAERLTNRAG